MFAQSTTTTTTTTTIDNQMTNAQWKLSLLSFRFPFVQVAFAAAAASSFRIVASQWVHWSVRKWQIKPGDWSSLVRPVRSTEVSERMKMKSVEEKWQRKIAKGTIWSDAEISNHIWKELPLLLFHLSIHFQSCCFLTLPLLSLSLSFAISIDLLRKWKCVEQVKIFASISATFAPLRLGNNNNFLLKKNCKLANLPQINDAQIIYN